MRYMSPEEDSVMRMLLGSCLITIALVLYPFEFIPIKSSVARV